ncbi:interleukin 4 [Rhinolophus ferrumequinum]|uniref:Interleukin-4 n=1 Tax=Rhinolophus ferrumequinum TaxID=59479 RepID=A0A7J7RXE5_RHIFE|nr:interleukin 4 [Rhinolophus ferrumequinum]
MHLTSQLIPALVCLLACTSNCLHGRELILLQEIIKTLNNLTETKDRYMELTVAEVLPAPKNTTEKEAFCRAAMELRKIYPPHPKDVTGKYLSKLDRNLSRLANMNSCPVNETKKITLKELLERLKQTMKKKYAKG